MNLPNKLTMMRVVLVPVFMIFAAVSHYGTADFHAAYMLIAGVIFAIASITDFLDGYLARKNHLVTDFGKFMDPLADKCLTTADTPLETGAFYKVTITDSDTYDLYGYAEERLED